MRVAITTAVWVYVISIAGPLNLGMVPVVFVSVSLAVAEDIKALL